MQEYIVDIWIIIKEENKMNNIKKSILIDWLPFDQNSKLLKESIEKNNGKLLCQGILQRADTRNQNNRIYPRSILERELNKYQTLIKERRALAELDHPDSPLVNLQNVSHLITEAHWGGKNNNDIIGIIEVLNTPMGRILKELLLADVKVGVSSRGLGSVKEINEDTLQVEEDFELVTLADIVSNPSTHNAFISPINLREAIEKNPVIGCRSKIDCIIQEILSEISK